MVRRPGTPGRNLRPMPALPVLPPFPPDGLRAGDIRLRLWDPAGDAEGRLRLSRDPEEDRWGTPWFIPRPLDASALLPDLERDVERARAGEPSSYAVAAADGRLLGGISTRVDLPLLRIADLGYGVLPEARGRGVASAALRLLAGWLLDPVAGAGLPRVQLDHAVGNAASCRVAANAGFDREGVRRAYLPLVDPGVPAGWARHDVCLHGRLAG